MGAGSYATIAFCGRGELLRNFSPINFFTADADLKRDFLR
jgi:hypothetical protein